MQQLAGLRNNQSEWPLGPVLERGSETPPHMPGINPVMTRYLGCLEEWGSRVKGRGQQRALRELRAVALCQPGQIYFNILTASALMCSHMCG